MNTYIECLNNTCITIDSPDGSVVKYAKNGQGIERLHGVLSVFKCSIKPVIGTRKKRLVIDILPDVLVYVDKNNTYKLLLHNREYEIGKVVLIQDLTEVHIYISKDNNHYTHRIPVTAEMKMQFLNFR